MHPKIRICSPGMLPGPPRVPMHLRVDAAWAAPENVNHSGQAIRRVRLYRAGCVCNVPPKKKRSHTLAPERHVHMLAVRSMCGTR